MIRDLQLWSRTGDDLPVWFERPRSQFKVDAWLEELVAHRQTERLIELKDSIEELLASTGVLKAQESDS